MLDNFFPVVVTQAFSSIWKASNETHPGAAYLFAAGLTLVSVSCAAITHLHLRGRNLYDEELHEGQAELDEALGLAAATISVDEDGFSEAASGSSSLTGSNWWRAWAEMEQAMPSHGSDALEALPEDSWSYSSWDPTTQGIVQQGRQARYAAQFANAMDMLMELESAFSNDEEIALPPIEQLSPQTKSSESSPRE